MGLQSEPSIHPLSSLQDANVSIPRRNELVFSILDIDSVFAHLALQ
jgi:hypothetical protein